MKADTDIVLLAAPVMAEAAAGPPPGESVTPPSFPAHTLPPLLANLGQELSVQMGMGQEVSALAGLVTLGSAVGPGVRVATGLGTETHGAALKLIVAAPPGSLVAQTLQTVLAPVHEAQAELHRIGWDFPGGTLDGQDLDRGRVRSGRREQPDAPLVFLTDPAPGHLATSLPRWLDGPPLMHTGDDYATQRFITGLTKDPHRGDLDLLRHPGSTAILVGSQSTLASFLTEPALVTAQVSPAFLVLDVPEPGRIQPAAFQPSTFSSRWRDLVLARFRERLNRRETVIPVRPRAQATLLGFHNEILAQEAGDPAHRPFRVLWPALAWHLTLTLHLGQERPGAAISEDTARDALTLLRWLGARQLAAVTRARFWLRSEEQDSEAETMLNKIRLYGPIKLRELCRKFKRHDQTLHEPVLARLMAKGRVYQDMPGHFRATDTVRTIQIITA